MSPEERETLERWARRPTTSQALAMRARVVLASAAGQSILDVARAEDISWATAKRRRARFIRKRLDGLVDEPRPGALRQVSDADVERVLTLTLSKDHLFIEKVRDLVGLYLQPPDRALVLSVDEKPQTHALDRSAPVLPMRPGQAERHAHDDIRHGTTTLFAALDVRTGRVIGERDERHRAREFRRFLDTIDAAVPPHLDIHLILDNYATHKTALIRRWLAKRPRYHVHFPPTIASWLNLVERWFVELREKQLRRGVHRSARQLVDSIERLLAVTNETAKPFVWTKTADRILAGVARCCERTSDSGHWLNLRYVESGCNRPVGAGLGSHLDGWQPATTYRTLEVRCAAS